MKYINKFSILSIFILIPLMLWIPIMYYWFTDNNYETMFPYIVSCQNRSRLLKKQGNNIEFLGVFLDIFVWIYIIFAILAFLQLLGIQLKYKNIVINLLDKSLILFYILFNMIVIMSLKLYSNIYI